MSNTLKDIVLRYIRPDNTLITDTWSGCNWISQPNSGFHHIINNHGHKQFGYADEWTAYIEQLWSSLKGFLKEFMFLLQGNFYILFFLREIEWRLILSLKNDEEKIKELLEIFDYIGNTANFILYDIDSFKVEF